MASENAFRVTVMYAPAPRQVVQISLTTNGTCTVLQALQQSGLLERFPEIDSHQTVLGVWGRQVALHHQLRDHDRVEVYRPLLVDPKLARRERFARQGTRGTGLFAKKRAGAKAGY